MNKAKRTTVYTTQHSLAGLHVGVVVVTHNVVRGSIGGSDGLGASAVKAVASGAVTDVSHKLRATRSAIVVLEQGANAVAVAGVVVVVAVVSGARGCAGATLAIVAARELACGGRVRE